MSPIALTHTGLEIDTSRGITADLLALVKDPEMARRPNELHWWKRDRVLVMASTHSSRLLRVRLDTGEVDVAAELDRRYSDLLGDEIQFLRFKQAPNGGLLVLYESGLVCLDRSGSLRWHRMHNDITAEFGPVDQEHVCIRRRRPFDQGECRTLFRLQDGWEVVQAA